MNEEFWQVLDKLLKESEIVIDRPKGTVHPRYPDLIYEVDYGYLKDTASADGAGIDIWMGSAAEKILDAIIVTVDLIKRDSEIKLLIACTEKEKEIIYQMHNKTSNMKGLLIRR